jgi:chemotaxis family two-component system sensor kinase Cph1
LFNANLTNCDLEPIHIPGKIQHHGFLIVANQSQQITCCSENIEAFLAVSVALVLGKPLNRLIQYFSPATSPDFFNQLFRVTIDKIESLNPYLLSIRGINYHLIVSVNKHQYLLEFEPVMMAPDTSLTKSASDSPTKIVKTVTMDAVLQEAATAIKAIIGYDRVMIYKFHADGHGEVVAEEKSVALESLLGLHYPASDIPKQARLLYMVNHVRLIADVHTEPAAIVGIEDLIATPLDLTFSVLRAVSPIHIQYLKNMGVTSSFSISIICNGALWGLVACHNYTPGFINYTQRESAKLVGQALALSIKQRQHAEDLAKQKSFDGAIGKLVKELCCNETIAVNPLTLLNMMEATGLALYHKEQWFIQGNPPDITFLTALTSWLADAINMQVYETNQLPIIYPAALQEKDRATGILACRISDELNAYIIWFRPEIIKTVSWAGNPEKRDTIAENGLLTIQPRQSFEAWKEVVEYTAQEWTWEDLQRAIKVRDQIDRTEG